MYNIFKLIFKVDEKRAIFHRYLEQCGVIDALSRALIKLYEEPTKPEDPVAFVQKHMCNTVEAIVDQTQEHERAEQSLAAVEDDQNINENTYNIDEKVPNEDASTEEIPNEDVPNEEVPNEEVPTEDVPTEAVPTEDALNAEVPTEEALNAETSEANNNDPENQSNVDADQINEESRYQQS